MPKTILLVDDERSIREALSKVLRAESYEVVLAENGEEAVTKQGERPADLMLLDLAMPAENGWMVFHRLAEINPLLPVVIITGRSNQLALAEEAGADALMEKPLDLPCLLRTIKELLDESLETRSRHVQERASGLRYGPCDNRLYQEMLLKRLTTPYPCPGGENK